MPNTKCLHCSNRVSTNKVCVDCRRSEQQATKFKPVIRAFIDSFPVPEGFVKETGEGWHNGTTHEKNGGWGIGQPWWRGSDYVLIRNEAAGIAISCCVSRAPEMHREWTKGKKPKKLPAKPVLSASGHTCFKAESGFWASFDRRGVSDSFYLGAYGDTAGDIERVIQEQIALVGRSREASKHMVSIPGFSYRVHQDNLEAMKKRIQSGASQTFTPSGFGTGHRLSTRRSRYSKQMPAETAAFFGVDALYDDTFDHD
jgi:hypothetical protein